MKKFYKSVCMFIGGILGFTGCSGNTHIGVQNEEQIIETQNAEQVTETPSVIKNTDSSEVTGETVTAKITEEFKTGINQFSYKIFEQLEEEENIFLSPYSMAIAISMLDNGASGQTKAEIEKMLGIKDLEEWNKCVKYYLSLNKEEKAKLLTANSLWLSEQLLLSENAETDFFNPVMNCYGAEKYQMNLSSEEALNQINDWVSDKTNQMIKKMLTEKPGREEKMMLINAVYFKGEWKEKFDKENTVEEEFYGREKTAEIDMMCKYNNSYRYIVKYGIKAIELPYGNENIVMDILLPEEGNEKLIYNLPNQTDTDAALPVSITWLFSNLSDKKKSNLFTALSKAEPKKVDIVKIPKFNMEYGGKEIADDLEALGMVQAFDSENAEFSKISPQLYVNSVLHKAKIEVDEEGTEAAAATKIGMRSTGMTEQKTFIANQPFLFVIRDRENDMILFMGSIQNLGE